MKQILQMTQIFWERVTLFILIFTQPKVPKYQNFWKKPFFGYEHHKLNEMDKKKCKDLFTEK